MNNSTSAAETEIICFCTGTTKRKINQLLAKGYHTVAEITAATGAGTGCGGCDVMLSALVQEFVKK